MHKHLTIVGTTLRSRSLEYKGRLVAAFADKFLYQFKAGSIKPVIDSVFKLEDIALAHKHMEANKNTGKIVIKV